MPNAHTHPWSDEQLATLKRLVAEGLSASFIAAQMHGITRNAVIGMARRCGLRLHGKRLAKLAPRAEPMHQRASRKPVTLAKVAPKAPAPRAAPPLPVITRREPLVFRAPQPPPEPVSRNLPLIEWTATTCKWIKGDGPPGLACGHPTYQGRPWCEHHARRAYA